MSADPIENFSSSVLQHGPENDRVYLMKLESSEVAQVISHINSLAATHRYSKAFVKIPASVHSIFVEDGYSVEAKIPTLFNGKEDGLFMARYYQKDRQTDHNADRVKEVLTAAELKSDREHVVALPEGCMLQLARPEHCNEMAELYRLTFASYPFPIQDPEYLATTMAENVLYAGIWKDSRLLAVASAEIDYANSNAELTDFATDPEWRGHGLANLLLQHLEIKLHHLDIKTGYTIARATSYGMNICFAQNGYQFSGTLVNNTQISGSLESMNVWHKSLKKLSNE